MFRDGKRLKVVLPVKMGSLFLRNLATEGRRGCLVILTKYYSINVEFEHIQGAVPELVLYNEKDEEVERLNLSRLTREECNNLLVSKGFTKKAGKDEI